MVEMVEMGAAAVRRLPSVCRRAPNLRPARRGRRIHKIDKIGATDGYWTVTVRTSLR